SDLNLFLQAMPGILQDTSTVTGKIAAQDQQLSALDVEFDRIAQMMAAEDQAFRRDIANGASLLDLTAAHETQLKAELGYADRDANGNLLRVHPYVFTGTEPVNPARIACSGGH